MTLRKCNACGLDKTSEHFHVKNSATGLLHRVCKLCRSKAAANDYKENRARFMQRNTRWKQANPQKVAVQRLAWQRANPSRVSAYNRKFRLGNLDHLASMRKADRVANPEKFALRFKRWRTKNSAKNSARVRAWMRENREELQSKRRERYAQDLNFKLTCLLRNRLHCATRRAKIPKLSSTLRLVGCSIGSLSDHLQTTMPQGGSWADVLAGRIHIDHIKPCALFDLTDLEEQRKCFHFSNLQLLWASDNLRKWKHYEPPVAACMAGIVTAFDAEP